MINLGITGLIFGQLNRNGATSCSIIAVNKGFLFPALHEWNQWMCFHDHFHKLTKICMYMCAKKRLHRDQVHVSKFSFTQSDFGSWNVEQPNLHFITFIRAVFVDTHLIFCKHITSLIVCCFKFFRLQVRSHQFDLRIETMLIIVCDFSVQLDNKWATQGF